MPKEKNRVVIRGGYYSYCDTVILVLKLVVRKNVRLCDKYLLLVSGSFFIDESTEKMMTFIHINLPLPIIKLIAFSRRFEIVVI